MPEQVQIALFVICLFAIVFGVGHLIFQVWRMIGDTLYDKHISPKLKSDPYDGLMRRHDVCIFNDEDMLQINRFVEFRDKQNKLIESIKEDIQENENDLIRYIMAKHGLKKFRINLDCLPLIEVKERIRI